MPEKHVVEWLPEKRWKALDDINLESSFQSFQKNVKNFFRIRGLFS